MNRPTLESQVPRQLPSTARIQTRWRHSCRSTLQIGCIASTGLAASWFLLAGPALASSTYGPDTYLASLLQETDAVPPPAKTAPSSDAVAQFIGDITPKGERSTKTVSTTSEQEKPPKVPSSALVLLNTAVRTERTVVEPVDGPEEQPLDEAKTPTAKVSFTAHRTAAKPKVGSITTTDAAGCKVAFDWHRHRLAAEDMAFMAKLKADGWNLRISCIDTGHSQNVKGKKVTSLHKLGLAFDIDQINGERVSPKSKQSKAFDAYLRALPNSALPFEVGGPFAHVTRGKALRNATKGVRGGPFFTNKGHQNHFHFGFKKIDGVLFDGPARPATPKAPLHVPTKPSAPAVPPRAIVEIPNVPVMMATLLDDVSGTPSPAGSQVDDTDVTAPPVIPTQETPLGVSGASVPAASPTIAADYIGGLVDQVPAAVPTVPAAPSSSVGVTASQDDAAPQASAPVVVPDQVVPAQPAPSETAPPSDEGQEVLVPPVADSPELVQPPEIVAIPVPTEPVAQVPVQPTPAPVLPAPAPSAPTAPAPAPPVPTPSVTAAPPISKSARKAVTIDPVVLLADYHRLQSDGVLPLLYAQADKHNIPHEIAIAMVSRETHAHNDLGDHGHGHCYLQIDDRSHGDWLNNHDWHDPNECFGYGMNLLRSQLDAFDQDMFKATAAYNSGAGNVRKSIRNGRSPESRTANHDYASDVMARADFFRIVIAPQ